MLTRFQHRLRADDGMSLVEMMVALLLLGVVLSASANMMISSFMAIGSAESRTRANALANEELENLRALPWSQLAYADAAQAVGVTYPAVHADGTVAFTNDISMGGRTFTVTRTVQWHILQTGVSQAFKRMHVDVAWQERGVVPRSLSMESVRARLPADEDAAPFVLSLFDAQPGVVHLNSDGTVRTTPAQSPPAVLLTARTSSPAEFVQVRYRQLGATVDTEKHLTNIEGGVGWTLTQSDMTMPNGEILFEFQAKRMSPYTDVVLGRKIVRFLYPQAFRTITLSPYEGVFCIAPSSATPDVTVQVDVDGMVAEDGVVVEWGGNAVAAVMSSFSSTGTAYTAIVPAGSYADDTTLTLRATRLGTDTITATRPIVVTRSDTCP